MLATMEPLVSFAQVASDYCSWCRSTPGEEEAEARTALLLLSRLQAGVLELEDPGRIEGIEGGACSQEDWEAVMRRSSIPIGHYWTFTDPSDLEVSDPVCGILADDIADIYRDLSEGLWLYDRGHFDDAQFHFMSLYWGHWGRHVSDAIRVLHCWLTR